MADAIKRWTPIEDEEGLGFVGMFSADNGRYVLHADHEAALKEAVAKEREACEAECARLENPLLIRNAIRARGAAND